MLVPISYESHINFLKEDIENLNYNLGEAYKIIAGNYAIINQFKGFGDSHKSKTFKDLQKQIKKSEKYISSIKKEIKKKQRELKRYEVAQRLGLKVRG